MSYFPTSDDIRILRHKQKQLFVACDLLDMNYQTVYRFVYEYVDGDMTTDTNADIRNTLNVRLAVTDETMSGFAEKNKLWINKFIKVSIGVKVPFIEAPKWYQKGIFVMTDFNIGVADHIITISCADLVCLLNGDVGGSLEGYKTIMYEKDKHTIREVIISTLTDLSPFKKYIVDNMPKTLPFDLEFSATDTVWSILTRLRDLYPRYEMFFDTDGVFVCRKMATVVSDPIVMDDSVLQDLIISESISGDLSQVRNTVKVWGKCLDADYTAELVSFDEGSNTYNVTFDDLALNDDNTLPTGAKFAIKIPMTNTEIGVKLSVNNKVTQTGSVTHVGTYKVVNSSEENIKVNSFAPNHTYVFRIRRGNMYLLGQWQIVAVNKLVNTEPTSAQKDQDKEKHGCNDITYTVITDSPFAVERIGERLKVFADGEYENIQAIDDCITRAEYENWKLSKIAYSVNLDIIDVPWFEGNEKIKLTLDATHNTQDWLVTNITRNLSDGIMHVTLAEFEPLYNFEIRE